MNERLTGFSAKELEDFLMLLPRIFSDFRVYSDPRNEPLELLYIYGETIDNDHSSLYRAIELANAGAMRCIGISGGEAANGYAGFDRTVKRLKVLGWKSNMPIVKLGDGGNANTLTEARALVEHARTSGGDIGIVAPAFHLVRAFMTVVSAMGDAPIRVYAILGSPLPWQEKVLHSQGVLENTRAGLLGDELKRLEKYRAPEFGSLLSAEAVLQYFEWRDK